MYVNYVQCTKEVCGQEVNKPACRTTTTNDEHLQNFNSHHCDKFLTKKRIFEATGGRSRRSEILSTVSPRLPNVLVTILITKPDFFVRIWGIWSFYKQEVVLQWRGRTFDRRLPTVSPCLPNVFGDNSHRKTGDFREEEEDILSPNFGYL